MLLETKFLGVDRARGRGPRRFVRIRGSISPPGRFTFMETNTTSDILLAMTDNLEYATQIREQSNNRLERHRRLVQILEQTTDRDRKFAIKKYKRKTTHKLRDITFQRQFFYSVCWSSYKLLQKTWMYLSQRPPT